MKKGILFVALIVVFVMAFSTVALAAWPPTVWNFAKDFAGPFLEVENVVVAAGTYAAPGYTGVTFATDNLYTGPALDSRGRTERIRVSQYATQPYSFGAAGTQIYTKSYGAGEYQGVIGDAAWVTANPTRFAEVDAAGAWGKPYYANPTAGTTTLPDPKGKYVYLQWWAVEHDNPAALADVTANTGSPHGGYTTATVKCAVCHSVHTAAPGRNDSGVVVADTLLRMKAAEACGYCHVAAGNVVDGDPIWGGNVAAISDKNGHNPGGTSCAECHTTVHGVNAENSIASLRGKLLATTGLDNSGSILQRVGLIEAKAVAQGFGADPKVTGFNADEYATETGDDIKYQAIGLFCNGCHDGSYSNVVAGASASTIDGGDAGMFTGHTTMAAAETANKAHSTLDKASSWGPVAGCTSCHDAQDGFDNPAFPHVWGFAPGVDAVYNTTTGAYEDQALLWLLSADSFGGTKSIIGEEAHAGANGGTLQDGVCLKCHVANGKAAGVGITY